MRLYTADDRCMESGTASRGIEVHKVTMGGVEIDAVLLGEMGRGRHLEKAPLDRRRPPAISEEKRGPRRWVHFADVRIAKTKRGALVVLEAERDRKRPAPPHVLVRVTSQAVYTRGTWGSVEPANDRARLLAQGHGAHGDAGRIGGWADTLVLFEPGGVVKVFPEGGHKTEPFVVHWNEGDGHPEVMTLEDFETVFAALGGGEIES